MSPARRPAGPLRRKARLARGGHLLKTSLRYGVSWWWARRRDAGPERLHRWLEAMGGSFVKLGQMLALQPDIVPATYCRALQDLLDRVPAIPFDEALEVIREETGRPASEIFDHLESEPLATASVAQVHVGWIDGHKLAVKIQRPTAEGEFGNDIRLVETFMRWIRRLRLRPLYWMLEPLGEFVSWTGEELDFRCEARYAEQLAELAEGSSTQKVPRPRRGLVTRRLLVIEFLEGTVLLDYLRGLEAVDPRAAEPRSMEPDDFDRNRFAANIVDNFLLDAFENGIYHADLHPANLMMLEGSAVGYVDFGITGVLSRHGRRQLMTMTLALATGDMDLFHGCFSELTAPDPNAAPERFRRGLDRLAASWYDEDRRLQVNFTRIMVDMLSLSRQTNFLPERDIVKYIRSSIAIDGLITRFAPDFDVGGYLGERCAAHLASARRQDYLALPRLLDWGATSGRLLSDGPERLQRLVAELERAADQEGAGDSERVDLEKPSSSEPALRPADRGLAIAVAMLVVSGLVTLLPPAQLEPGLNLWTVQMLFLGAAAFLLVAEAWRGAQP